MSTETATFTAGQTVTVIAAPGYPTDTRITVLVVEPRKVTTVGLGEGVEVFTLRRNGKFALKGGGQWTNYLREVAA